MVFILLDQRPRFREQLQTADTWKIQVSRYRGTESKTKPRRRDTAGRHRNEEEGEEADSGERVLPNSCQALLDRRAKLPVCVHSTHCPEVSSFEVEAK